MAEVILLEGDCCCCPYGDLWKFTECIVSSNPIVFYSYGDFEDYENKVLSLTFHNKEEFENTCVEEEGGPGCNGVYGCPVGFYIEKVCEAPVGSGIPYNNCWESNPRNDDHYLCDATTANICAIHEAVPPEIGDRCQNYYDYWENGSGCCCDYCECGSMPCHVTIEFGDVIEDEENNCVFAGLDVNCLDNLEWNSSLAGRCSWTACSVEDCCSMCHLGISVITLRYGTFTLPCSTDIKVGWLLIFSCATGCQNLYWAKVLKDYTEPADLVTTNCRTDVAGTYTFYGQRWICSPGSFCLTAAQVADGGCHIGDATVTVVD